MESYFDTVKEAQDFSAMHNGKTFQIFTLYSSGARPPVAWKINTDHVTNERENKKVSAAQRGGIWTDIELKTLRENFKAGMSMVDIAAALKRSYNSVYTKVRNLKKDDRI